MEASTFTSPSLEQRIAEAVDNAAEPSESSILPLLAAIRGIADGKPYEEIAATFSIDAKSVNNAAQRARRKLARALEPIAA